MLKLGDFIWKAAWLLIKWALGEKKEKKKVVFSVNEDKNACTVVDQQIIERREKMSRGKFRTHISLTKKSNFFF